MPDAKERSETLTRASAPEKVFPQPAAGASQRVAHYDLRREIGRGGMSIVYQARERATGKDMALKLLTLPQSLTPDEAGNLAARFDRGARTVAGFSHPNVVSISEVGVYQGRHFVAMEYLHGQTLRERMSARKLTTREVCSILTQIAGALKTAHSTGIVHRDLKPTNIMLLPNGTLKLLDFGIAPSSSETAVADAGILTGTPSCMAPEQVSGQPETSATDVWALGVLSYEMLTGRLPFSGQTAEAIFDHVLHQSPAPMPGQPEAVQKVLHRVLEKNPALRYPSAAAFVQALNAAVTQSVPAVSKPAPAAPNVKPEFIFESALPKPAAPNVKSDFVFEKAVPKGISAQKSEPLPASKPDAPPRSARYRWPVGVAMGLLFLLAFCSAFFGRQHVSELGRQHVSELGRQHVSELGRQHVSNAGETAAVNRPALLPVPPAPKPAPMMPLLPEAQVVPRPEAQVVPLRHQAATLKEDPLPPIRKNPVRKDPVLQAVPKHLPKQPITLPQVAVMPTHRPLAAVVVKRIVHPALTQVAVRPVSKQVTHRSSTMQPSRAVAVQPVTAQPAAIRVAARPVPAHNVIHPVPAQTADRAEPVQNAALGFTLPSDAAGYDPEAEARQRKSAWSRSGAASNP